MSLRSSHGCQSSDIQKSSSNQKANQSQRSSWARCSQQEPWWRTHHARSSSNSHSDTATRAMEEQNLWYKPYANSLKPATRSKMRRAQESPSMSTVLCSLGHHDTQHGNTRDPTNDKTQQPQPTRRFDTCLTKTKPYSSETQLRADDQEHWSTSWNQHGSKAFGSDVTAQQISRFEAVH